MNIFKSLFSINFLDLNTLVNTTVARIDRNLTALTKSISGKNDWTNFLNCWLFSSSFQIHLDVVDMFTTANTAKNIDIADINKTVNCKRCSILFCICCEKFFLFDCFILTALSTSFDAQKSNFTTQINRIDTDANTLRASLTSKLDFSIIFWLSSSRVLFNFLFNFLVCH